MDTIQEGDNLPEWAQEKLSLAEDYLTTVWDYLLSQKEQGMDPKVTEGSQRVDSLVTDALKIMRGSDYQVDAVKAIKTVLGEREYNSRRGHYNFYVRQLMDMHSQQGVTETKKPSPKLTPVNIKKSDPVSEEINNEAYERLQKVFAFKNYES
jgi:ribonucleotide reductase beta subunit family protein with ferritin-like domain